MSFPDDFAGFAEWGFLRLKDHLSLMGAPAKMIG